MQNTNSKRIEEYFRELGVYNLQYEMVRSPHNFLDDCHFALRRAERELSKGDYRAILEIIDPFTRKAQKLWEKVGS